MRYWSINLFSVFGIRLEVHATFLILVGLFAWTGWALDGVGAMFWSVLFILAVFGCVVLHELGHSLVAQRYGIEVIRILLLPIGGMAQFQSVPREARKEVIIALAGPLVNFALAVPLFALGGIPREFLALSLGGYFPLVNTQTFFQALLIVNLVMGMFNLLPIFPMDGGRMFRAFLTYRLSYLKATGTAAIVSKILASAGIALALVGLPLLGYQIAILPALLFAFIFIAGNLEYRMVERKETLKDLHVGHLLDSDFSTVRPDIPVGEGLRLLNEEGSRVLLLVEKGSLFGMLTRQQADILTEEQFLHTDPVGRHCERNISILQAEWPLDLFYEMLARNKRKIFPVFQGGRLAGILDTGRLDEKLAEHGISAKRLKLPF